jgi:hypothetical protein
VTEAQKRLEYLQRLRVANEVVATFVPGVSFYEVLRAKPRGLRMTWPNNPSLPTKYYDFPAILRQDGSWPKYGYNQRPCGGTGYQAIAQLIRYIRNLSRFPLCTWEYWASDTVKLCSDATLQLLRASDYSDSRYTACVLCGTVEYKLGLDWWSLDGVTGPSCFGGRCIPEWWALKQDVRFAPWLKQYRAKSAAVVDPVS